MWDSPWQQTLARLATFLTCVGIAVVVILVAVTVAAPQRGSDAGGIGSAALPLVLIAAAALLLLIAGMLREKQAIADRLPNVTLFRLALAVVLIAAGLPVFHLGFAVGLCLVTLVALTAIPRPLTKLRAVAFFSAVLCAGIAEMMRRAGVRGDFAVAHAVLGGYAAIGAVLQPAMATLSSASFTPRLAWLTCIGYGVGALHAGAIILFALGSAVNESLGGSIVTVTSERCVPQLLKSPIVLLLQTLQSSVQAKAYAGPPSALPPCPGATGKAPVQEILAPTCQPMHVEVLGFFLVLGAWLASALAMLLRSDFESRIAPSPAAVEPESPVSPVPPELPESPKSPARGSSDLPALPWEPRLSAPSKPASPSGSRPGSRHASRPGTSGSLRSKNPSRSFSGGTGSGRLPASTPAPLALEDEQAPQEEEEGPPAPPKPPSRLARCCSSCWSGFRSFCREYRFRIVTSTLFAAAIVGVVLLGVVGFVCPADRGLVLHPAAKANVTDEGPVPVNPNCTHVAVVVTAPPTAPVPCDCSASRGVNSFVTVPAEQAAATWCDLGMWAPVVLWSLLYICHGFACSLSGQLAVSYSKEVATRRRNLALEKKRQELRNPVKKEMRPEDAPLFRKVQYDPIPRPVDVTGYGRVFKV